MVKQVSSNRASSVQVLHQVNRQDEVLGLDYVRLDLVRYIRIGWVTYD